MAEEIEIICTVEELTDYANPATRTFAANFSVGMKGTAAPAQPLTQALLQPWMWKLTGLGLWCQLSDSDPTNTPKTQPVPTMMAAPALAGTSLGVLQAGMSAQFQTALAQTVAGDALFAWDPTDPGAPPQTMLDSNGNQIPRWPEFLGHASTFPAPLPHNLNLVVFFQVQTNSLQGVARMQVAPAFSVTTLGATVNYVAPTKTPVAPTAAPVTVPPTPPPATPQQGYRWDYSPGQNDTSGCIVAAHQAGLEIEAYPFAAGNAANAAASAQVSGGTMWIRPEPEFGNEDWRTTLELRASETFDLGRQVLNALRDPIPTQIPNPTAGGNPTTIYPTPTSATIFGATPVYGEVELLRRTVLAILRDTADFGRRFAPDGSNLFRFVLHQMTAPDGFDVNGFITDAEAKLKAAEGQVTLADDGVRDWQKTLAAIPGVDTLALTTIAPVPATKPPATDSPFPEKDFSNLLRSLAAVQKLLAQDTTLATLLYAAWDGVLAADPLTKDDWLKVRALVQAQLGTLAASSGGLRKRMLLANLGGSDPNTLTTWQQLINISVSGSASETDQIRANLAAALPAYFSLRTSNNSDRLPVVPSTLSTKASAFLLTGVTAAGVAAKSILPQDATQVPPSPTAQPVVLRIHTTAQPASDADDPLRGIAGVCLLLREQAVAPSIVPKPWSCINVAELDVLDAMHPMTYDDGTTGPSPAMAEDVTFVPHRLITRNGIPQTALSYDNRPLAAPSPADDLTTYFKPTRSPDYGSIFEYSHVAKATTLAGSSNIGGWARMSGLKYGRSYDSIAFSVRNSGALPRLLADLNAPNATTGTQGVLPTAPVVPISPDAFAPVAPAAAIASFLYQRRTPVGQVRIRIADGNGYEKDLNQQSLPVIPPTVAPLAREADIANTVPATSPTSTQDKLPLLMLWNSNSKTKPRDSYAFDVRPPAADPQVWDRWVAGMAGDDSYRVTRAAVAVDFALNTPKNMQDPSINSSDGTSGTDITLNDPAVTCVCFSLVPVYPPNAAVANATPPRCVPVPALQKNLAEGSLAANAGFSQVQGKLASVTVRMSSDASASLSVAPASVAADHSIGPAAVTITIPTGQVWKLAISPAIDPATQNTFDPNATRSQFAGQPVTYQEPGTDANATMSLIPSATPMEMLVECAQQSSLIPQDLWQAMQFTLPAGAGSTKLALNLSPRSGADWHLIRHIKFARQAWRWMGRPIFLDVDFPSIQLGDLNGIIPKGNGNDPGPALTAALNWEIQAFAERDYDPSLPDTSVIFPTGTLVNGSVSKKIHEEDLGSDLRAHYFRFGARMWSRYEGLPGFKPFVNAGAAQSIEAKVEFNDIEVNGAVKPGGSTTWARVFVPCRITRWASLPKPSILLCLPLTAAAKRQDDDPTTRTSVLVIADEPWYQVAGLAEQLVATIEEVTLEQPANDLHALQFGPDPILSTSGYSASYQTPTGEVQQTSPIAPQTWIGRPIGTTFDDASTAPLLNNTCFQFPLSDLVFPGANQPGPLDWFMAKLHFQRVINADMTATPGAASGLTDGVQVQFVPSSNHFTTSRRETVDVSNITFGWDTNNRLQLTETTLGIVSLQPGPATQTPAPNLLLWGLLMQGITDAAGQRGEAYVGLYDFHAGNPIANKALVSTVYLIEVQSVPNPQGPTTTWLDQLVPGSDTGEPDATVEVMYRALRMSEGIQSSDR